MNWLRRLLHLHRWTIIGQGYIADHGEQPSGVYYVLQCTECGDVKHRKVQ
jgi:hypothetical protein